LTYLTAGVKYLDMNIKKSVQMVFSMAVLFGAGLNPLWAGSISGTVSYGGGGTGNVLIGAFDNAAFLGDPAGFAVVTTPLPKAYSITNLPNGSYYLGAFLDLNGDNQRQAEEPSGYYAGNPVAVTALAPNPTGRNLTLTVPALQEEYRFHSLLFGPDDENGFQRGRVRLYNNGQAAVEFEGESGLTASWSRDGHGFTTFLSESDGEVDTQLFYGAGDFMITASGGIAQDGPDPASRLYEAQLMVAVRKQAVTYSAVDLAGEYNLVEMECGGAHGNSWVRGVVSVDGDGNLTFDLVDSDGQAHQGGFGPLAISADGIITADGQPDFKGVMSPEKRAVLATMTSRPGVYSLQMLARRSNGLNGASLPGGYTFFEATVSDSHSQVEARLGTLEVEADLDYRVLEWCRMKYDSLLYHQGRFAFVPEQPGVFAPVSNPYLAAFGGLEVGSGVKLLASSRLGPAGGYAVAIGLSGPDYAADRTAIAALTTNFVAQYNSNPANIGPFFDNDFYFRGMNKAAAVADMLPEAGEDPYVVVSGLENIILRDRALTFFHLQMRDGGAAGPVIEEGDEAYDYLNYLRHNGSAWLFFGNQSRSGPPQAAAINWSRSETSNGGRVQFEVESDGFVINDCQVAGPGVTDPVQFNYWSDQEEGYSQASGQLEDFTPPLGAVYTFRVAYDNRVELIQDSVESLFTTAPRVTAPADGVILADTSGNRRPDFAWTMETDGEPQATSYKIWLERTGQDWQRFFDFYDLPLSRFLVSGSNYRAAYADYQEELPDGVSELSPGNYSFRVNLYDRFNNGAEGISDFGIGQGRLSIRSQYWNCQPAPGDYFYNYNTPVNARADAVVDLGGYTRAACTGWTGSGAVAAQGFENEVNFNLTANSTLEWHWSVQHWLSKSVNGIGCDVLGADTWIEAGSRATVTAVAGAGWFFDHWVIDGVDRTDLDTPVLSLTVDNPVQVHAIFEELWPLDIEISPAGFGSVSLEPAPAAAPNFYPAGQLVNLTARPNGGYAFQGWNGVDTVSGSTAQVTVGWGGRSVTAFFNNGPWLTVSDTALVFTGDPQALSLTLTNTGGENLGWEAAEAIPWLGLSKTAGALAKDGGSEIITLTRTGGAAGSRGVVTFQQPAGSFQSPIEVTVVIPAPGDLNFDLTVDLADAELALRILVDPESYSEAQRQAADLDGSGAVDIEDVVAVYRLLLGI